MRALALGLVTLLPLPALADCAGETVLACQIGKKAMAICATATDMTYSFGPKGAPEMELTVPLKDSPVAPWSGVGRAIWESALFQNAELVYEVWVSVDKMTEDAPLEAGINVLVGEELKAELTCDAGSVTGNGVFALSDVMAGAGYCWNFDTFQWATTCP